MGNVKIFTKADFKQSDSVQMIMPGDIKKKLDVGAKLEPFMKNGKPEKATWKNGAGDVVVYCRDLSGKRGDNRVALNAVMVAKIEGMIVDEDGWSLPEGKVFQMVDTDGRLALVDRA